MLDRARDALGDRIELRSARALVWAGSGAPKQEVVKILGGLTEGLEKFTKEQRRPLLEKLAEALEDQRDVNGARKIWERLAEDNPRSIVPHEHLLDMAYRDALGSAGADAQAQGA